MDSDGGPQQYMVLKLERESSSVAAKLPGEAPAEDKGPTHKGAEPEDQSHEAQDGHDAAVPTSPVLSQMSMPGAWLLNHRRLPGMLGQMTSDIMGRAQLDQVRLTQLWSERNLFRSTDDSKVLRATDSMPACAVHEVCVPFNDYLNVVSPPAVGYSRRCKRGVMRFH